MTWEGTSGNIAKIGLMRRKSATPCAVRLGSITSATICLLHVEATASLMVVALLSGFGVLWQLSLRGKAGLFFFYFFDF